MERKRCAVERFNFNYFFFTVLLSAWFIALAGIAYAAPSYVSLSSSPRDIAVNPDTNKIYVATGRDVTIVNGTDNSTVSVAPVTAGYRNLAINRRTNKIYAASGENGVSVAVIDGDDGSFNMITNIGTAGSEPTAMAVNEAINRVYVAYQDENNNGSLAIIDGAAENVAASVYSSIAVGKTPCAIAVNQAASRIYVANSGSDSVSVIDAVYNNVITTISVGKNPLDIAINEKTNKIYVANYGIPGGYGTVTVIDGVQNKVINTINAGINPCSLAVNRETNRIYVANAGYNRSYTSSYVTCINGEKDSTTRINPQEILSPRSIMVNEDANEIYVANYDKSVTIISGTTGSITVIPISSNLDTQRYIAFNPSSNKVYVAYDSGNNFYILAIIDLPAFISATTNENGTAIILTFSGIMAEPSGKHGQFSATVNGEPRHFSAAALHPGDDARIDLTLEGTPISPGDTVTVTYRAGDIRDLASRPLQSFTDEAVINKVVRFEIIVPSPVKAGVPFNITINAQEQGRAIYYSGTKTLAFSGPGTSPGGFMPRYTNTVSFEKGYAQNISTTLFRAETAALVAADGGARGSAWITVEPADISCFEVTTQNVGREKAGKPFSVILKAKDAYGNLATGYTGIHSISWNWTASGSPNGTLPVKPADGSVMFTNGMAAVDGFMLTNAGEMPAITVIDESGHTGGASIMVEPGPASLFAITAPQTVTAGSEFAIQLITKDTYGNIAAGYRGTVHLTSTDSKAILSDVYTFTGSDGGVKDFKLTLKTAGTHTITATDTETEVLSATTRGITVSAGALDAQRSAVNAHPDSVPADGRTSSTVTVLLKDACDNPLKGHAVVLERDDGASQIMPLLGISDTDGKVEFIVSSSRADTVTFTAVDVTDHESVVGTARVVFTSTNANLKGFSLSRGSFKPEFDPGITEYTASVDNSVSSLTVTPILEDINARVAINGIPVAGGQTSQPIDLNVGSNTITVLVTAQDGVTTKTYTITVNRANPPEGGGGNGKPDFSGDGSGDAGGVENGDTGKGKSTDAAGSNGRHTAIPKTLPVIIHGTVNPSNFSTLLSDDKKVKLKFPSGFISAPAGASVRVTVREISGTDMENMLETAIKPEGFKATGKALEFTAETIAAGQHTPITSFIKPVTLTIELSGADLKGVTYPEKMGLFRLEHDGTLTFAGGKVIDNSLTVQMYGFSRYILGEVSITFRDLKGHWAKDDIELMAAKHVVRGLPGGDFQPEGRVTRAQFAAMLVRAMGIPAGGEALSFSDVKSGDWYYGELQAAIKVGIITGFEDGSFRPDAPVTREQAAVMMARALRAGDKAEELNADEMETILSDFTDKENINNWAKNDLALAVKTGTVSGQTPIIMAPQAALSRAEAAVMVSRYWRK